MKKWMIAGLVAILATLVIVPAAAAAEADDTARVALAGRGLLQAGGTGTVEISGAGWARLVLDGEVTIVDRAGDARIWVRGVPAAQDTALTLEGFQGVVRIIGSDFTLEAEGRILLVAAGHGTAVLEGRGWYRVRHGGWGRWTDTGTGLTYPA